MAKDNPLKRIISELEKAKRPSSFYTSGSFNVEDAQIAVAGIGPIKFPMRTADISKLCDVAVQAPYGRRTETIVDKEVRDTLEIPANEVSFSKEFSEKLKFAIETIASTLHLEINRLDCEPYKLLIYKKGGFFLPHRDSEKKKGMVASLVVVLPTKFRGGDLIVKHEQIQKRFDFETARSQTQAEFVAFFADCVHEVKKVTSGFRVGLTFNLILRDVPKPKSSKQAMKSNAELRQAIEGWISHRAESPIVFSLEHLYTSEGLEPDLLKGADAVLFEELLCIAKELDCNIHLGQVSRHLCQYADDGSFEFGRRGYHRFSDDYSQLNIGETFDDEIEIDGWKDATGKSKKLPSLPCESSQLISATPIEQWIPTKQDYEGYTGNAGNTLNRWYHKSAIILWPNSKHFDVLTQMGLKYAIAEFLGLFAKRSKLKNEKLANATLECIAFAKAIIAAWPDRTHSSPNQGEIESMCANFSEALPQLQSLELVSEFLQTAARRDRRLDLIKLITKSWKEFGRESTLPLIRDLLLYEPQPNKYGITFNAGLAERDAVWLCKLSKAQLLSHDLDFSQLIAIACRKIATHFGDLAKENYRIRSEPPTSAWWQLILACLYGRDEDRLNELLQLPNEFPTILELREVLVPTAVKLMEWKGKAGESLPGIAWNWIESIRQKLRVATNEKPHEPSDQTRESAMRCHCEYCVQLRDFLRDPDQAEFEIKAAEHHRNHMQHEIEYQSLDLKFQKIRVGNRYALRFTKTTGSYQRALKQYENDLKLLAKLELT